MAIPDFVNPDVRFFDKTKWRPRFGPQLPSLVAKIFHYVFRNFFRFSSWFPPFVSSGAVKKTTDCGEKR